MVEAAPHNNFEMRRSVVCHLHYLEVAFEPVALALNGSVNFDTVVANFKLLVKAPELCMATWTLDFLLLLSATRVHLGRNLYFLGEFYCRAFRVLMGALSVSTVARLVAYTSD